MKGTDIIKDTIIKVAFVIKHYLCPKVYGLAFLLFISLMLISCSNDSIALSLMEDTWQQFRAIHPFSFQTVALKHYGDTCVFVISEPAEWVREDELRGLFDEYNGQFSIGKKSCGYDGGLYDAIGCAKLDPVHFKEFERKLFGLLYKTGYKPCYTDLDNPSDHVYFSDTKLNYDISPNDLFLWMFGSNQEKEKFIVPTQTQKDMSLHELTGADNLTNEIYYSKKRGFVVWKIKPSAFEKSNISFRINARKFALDTDLITGAINIDGCLFVIAREREIPVTILPPLRSETISLLSTIDENDLFVCLFLDSVISVEGDSVWATPIVMGESLKNTELGILMFLTDLMLKSWSENAKVKDSFIDYLLPSNFPFNVGVEKELGYSPKYLWTRENFDYQSFSENKSNINVYAIGQTGSMIPSYKDLKDSLSVKARKAASIASNYFASLNNTDLVRIKQYLFLYQIFKSYNKHNEINRNKEIGSYNALESFKEESWIQTPSITVSNIPWGYGGFSSQKNVIKKDVFYAIMGKEFSPKPIIIRNSPIYVPVTSVRLGLQLVPHESTPISVRLGLQLVPHESTPISRRLGLQLVPHESTPISGRLGLQLVPHESTPIVYQKGSEPVYDNKTNSRNSNQIETSSIEHLQREKFINTNSKQIERGFIPSAPHNIKDKNNQPSLIIPAHTSKWKDMMREKILNKSHRINKNVKEFTFIAYITIKCNNNEEYVIGYAA